MRVTKAAQKRRRARVFRGIAAGKSVAQIAEELGVDPGTVSQDARAVEPEMERWAADHIRGTLTMAIATYQALLDEAWQRIDDPRVAPRDAAAWATVGKNATDALTRLAGLVKEKHEHSGPNGGPIVTKSVREMSEDELDALIAAGDDGEGPA